MEETVSNLQLVKQRAKKIRKRLSVIVKMNDINVIETFHPFVRVRLRKGEHVLEYKRVPGQNTAVDFEEGGTCDKDGISVLIV